MMLPGGIFGLMVCSGWLLFVSLSGAGYWRLRPQPCLLLLVFCVTTGMLAGYAFTGDGGFCR